MPGIGERRRRLKRFTLQLRPPPEGDPYYLHSPGAPDEPAPGWYMRLEGAAVYLGASAGDAEVFLRRRLEDQAAAKPRRARARARKAAPA